MDVIGEGRRECAKNVASGLTAGPAGFDYDFGALDDAHNTIIQLYENLL